MCAPRAGYSRRGQSGQPGGNGHLSRWADCRTGGCRVCAAADEGCGRLLRRVEHGAFTHGDRYYRKRETVQADSDPVGEMLRRVLLSAVIACVVGIGLSRRVGELRAQPMAGLFTTP